MIYPIFNSVVNQIESDLRKREIFIKTFRTWNEDRINATGLEIEIDLSRNSNFIKTLCINLDWDRFRETVLARQLEGLDEHPFLQEENIVSTSIKPDIDIEISWFFDEMAPNSELAAANGYHKVEAASRWMEEINQNINDLLVDDDIITRWHVEIEGTQKGKYLSAVNLISYFQYTFEEMKSLSDVHAFVLEIMHDLLIKSSRIIQLSEKTLQDEAA